jgi:LytS/YehU family sensor histidine kinase
VEPAALLAPIPILSIQPLVENAVKHGIAPQPGGGLVRIEARIESDSLRVKVSDTGGGFASERSRSEVGRPGVNPAAGPGVGMDNVNRRLQLCYGPEACLDIRSGSGGSSVSFAIPVSSAALPQSFVSENPAFEPHAEARVIEAGD